MNKSESIKELAGALAKAQGEIKGALKDQNNPFFKSKYADLGSVVEAIRAPLSKHGLSYVQLTEPTEKDEVRVETVILHASGEWIGSVLALPVSKADAQGFGSALTYARRYGLSAAFGVAPEDDDGNAAAKAAPEDRWTSPKVDALKLMSEPQMVRLRKCVSSVFDCLNAENVEGACNVIDAEQFDSDEKVALWTFFDSKQRSAMKRVWGARTKETLKREEATQA
jgi:hypothetical protein